LEGDLSFQDQARKEKTKVLGEGKRNQGKKKKKSAKREARLDRSTDKGELILFKTGEGRDRERRKSFFLRAGCFETFSCHCTKRSKN